MKRNVLSTSITIVALFLIIGTMYAAGQGELSTDKICYAPGETVTFTFTNTGDLPIRTRFIESTYWIDNDQGVMVLEYNPIQPITPLEYLNPDESHIWTWDQKYLIYNKNPPFNPVPPTGQQVPNGVYIANLDWYPDFPDPYPGGIAKTGFAICEPDDEDEDDE